MSIVEKFGKYEVLERVGSGAMGTIFKAHDPVLNRTVALKVISGNVEVTDGLRARFFREAQACARLSHPNIVTIYDLGEANGRLFIVMEYLEGQDLKRLIAQRSPLALEDKLFIMRQVCDGLHYAHQQGVVHRDIKPGNILLKLNGQVKILDFGVARIANAERDLTQTGLIMGTLRYIAPEQVRGHADSRSDVFSVGAVFYELLSWRAPFTGRDAVQLLEQLRTEDPPALHQVDPGLPVELADIVAHAMRKDPADRVADLEEMRLRIEKVQHKLLDEAQRVRTRIRGQRDRLRELQAAFVERVGAPLAAEVIPVTQDRDRLAALQALEQDLAQQIEGMEAKLARAVALAPAVQRGLESLGAGRFEDAVAELGTVVAQMPEHARALEGLEQARALGEAARRRQLAGLLVEDARRALEEGAFAFCLEILKQMDEIPAPEELSRAVQSLRATAESGLAAVEVRRAQERVEGAWEKLAQAEAPVRVAAPESGQGVEARDSGDGSDVDAQATRHLPGGWSPAEGRARPPSGVSPRPSRQREGEARVVGAAAGARDEVTPLERGWDRWAHEVHEPDARWPWLRWARGIAVVIGVFAVIATVMAHWPLWGTGPRPSTTQRPTSPPPAGPESSREQGARGFQDSLKEGTGARKEAVRARAEPRPATRAAGSAREGEAALSQRDAASAPPPSGQAVARDVQAKGEVERPSLPPRQASAPRLDGPSGEARPPERPTATKTRRDADQARTRLTSVKRAAEQAAAGFYAPQLLASARAKEFDGVEAFGRSDYDSAVRLLDEARANYQAAVEGAQRDAETEKQLGPVKASVAEWRAATIARREEALAAQADHLARTIFEKAQARHADADGLAGGQSFAAAVQAYQEAAKDYEAATRRARSAREAK